MIFKGGNLSNLGVIEKLPFNIQNFLKSIVDKYGYISSKEDIFKNTFDKNRKLSVENLFSKEEIDKIKNLLNNKKIVIVKNETIDSSLAYENILEIFNSYGIKIENTIFIKNNKSPVSYKDIIDGLKKEEDNKQEKLEDIVNKQNNLDDYFFITIGQSLNSLNKIQELVNKNANLLIVDNTRVGNDYIPTNQVEYLIKNYKDKIFILNPYISDYGNKNVSNTILITKTFSKILEQKKIPSKKIYSQKIDIFNGLSVISNKFGLGTFENRILAGKCIEALNNPVDKNVSKKMDLLKQALKIDFYDIENINTKLIPFMYGFNKAVNQEEFYLEKLDEKIEQKDFSYIIDFIFNSEINENEFKQILRTVLYLQDKERNKLESEYGEIQKLLEGNNDKNIYITYDSERGKIIINNKEFPNDLIDENGNYEFRNISFSRVELLANKLKNDTFKNVFIISESKEDVYISMNTYEKYGMKLKDFIKKHKENIKNVSGEDYNYNLIISKNIKKDFEEFVNNEFNNDIKESIKNNIIQVKDFSYLKPNIVSIINRDLGITDPGKIIFGIKGTIYKFISNEQGKFIIIKDEKGEKNSINVNDYYYFYIKENYELGDDILINIKTSLITDNRGDLKTSFHLIGLGLNDTLTFKEIKNEVDAIITKNNEIFSGMLEKFNNKITYEIVLYYLKKEKDIYLALGKAQNDLMYLHKIQENQKVTGKIEEIKTSIQDFIINKNKSLDNILDIEKNRLLFGGIHILPFLVKEGNEIFLTNKEDKKIYNDFLNQRNKLFFKTKEIYDWFKMNYQENNDVENDNSVLNTESINFVKEVLSLIDKEISKERKNIKFLEKKDLKIDENTKNDTIAKSIDKIIILLQKQKELKEILSGINSLKTTVKNTYYIRYTQKNIIKKNNTILSDLIFDKEKAALAYYEDKFNDKLFYSNFYNASHFVNTIKLVFKDDDKKILKELTNFLNYNNYNSIFDSFIEVLDNNDLGNNFDYKELVKGLTNETKLKLIDLINQEKYSIIFKQVFNIDILESNREKVKKEILNKLGLIDEFNEKKGIDNINYVLLKRSEIEQKINSMLKNNKKPEDIINWLFNGDIDGISVTELIKKGLTLTNYLDPQYLMLAYLRDLGALKNNAINGKTGYKRNFKLLSNTQHVSRLSKELLFMKNEDKELGGIRYAIKILSQFKNKDTIISALDKEMSLFLSDTIRDSVNKNKSLIGYFKNIFNIYGLQSSFIGEQLVNSIYISYIHENLKKINKELMIEYETYLKNIIENSNEKIEGISYKDYLYQKIVKLSEFVNDDLTSKPLKSTIDNSNIGLKKYGFIKTIYLLNEKGYNVNLLEDVRKFIAKKLASTIDYSSNNYITSQSESFFIFNIQRKLFDGFKIEKARDITYKDITKEIFALLTEEDRNKLYSILIKTNSYGKNIIPDFVIRNKVGNIVGVGEIFGGHSDDSENYEELKKIKIDILNIFKKAGINTFFCNYDEKNKNGKINEYLFKFNKDVNKGINSIKKSEKEYISYIEKNNLENLFETKIKIKNDDIDNYNPIPINKLSISNIYRYIQKEQRKILFFDTETTGFARKIDPIDFRGSSVFQLAYSDRKGNFISKQFKEIKQPLIKKIEDLTHQSRKDLLLFGQDPIIGMTDFLFEIIGPELEKIVKDPKKTKNLKRRLENNSHKFAIIVGHNSFAFDSAMIGNMIKNIYLDDSNKEFFKKNPGIKIMYKFFIENGFDMGDTLQYSREILDINKNPFIGEYELGNDDNKLGNLYKLSQIKLAKINGKNLNEFIPKLEAKILKSAHNAQFDIEMTKGVFDYIIKVYENSQKELNNISSKYLEEFKNGENFVKYNNEFLNLNREIKKLDLHIKKYNELLKLIVLVIGKTDVEVNYIDDKISINRISDYKKIKYDANKLKDLLEGYGLSKEEIENTGLIKEVISKKNIKILSEFIQKTGINDLDSEIYDYLDEKLTIKDHGYGKTLEQEEISKMVDNIASIIYKIANNTEKITDLLNEVIIRKEESFKKKKQLELEKIKSVLILEETIKKIFNLKFSNSKEYNELILNFKEAGITLNEIENKITFNIKESLPEEDITFLDKIGVKYNIIENKKLVKIENINSFIKNKGANWASKNNIVYYTKKEQNKEVLYLYKKGNLNGSYTLKRNSIINIDRLKEIISESFILNLPQEVKDQILEIMIDRRINNKILNNNFKNTSILFKELESYFTKIIRTSNFLKIKS